MRSAQRGSKLVGRLLSFVRSRDLVIEPFEVHNVVHELEDLLREACGSHVKLLLDIKDTSWSVATDVSQFETALLNLVINAKDASSEEGVIKITVDNVGAGSQGECNKNSAIPNQYVCISVVDTGSGIPKSIIDKITEPFFTTKEVGKGTGLGLSLVKSIVTSSGGILDIESEEGVGTTVSILLPRFKKTPIIETVAEVETRVDAEQRSAQSGV